RAKAAPAVRPARRVKAAPAVRAAQPAKVAPPARVAPQAKAVQQGPVACEMVALAWPAKPGPQEPAVRPTAGWVTQRVGPEGLRGARAKVAPRARPARLARQVTRDPAVPVAVRMTVAAPTR